MDREWLVNEDIDVDIQQLGNFAEALRREMEENFQPSFDNGLRPMLTVQAPFGGGGLKEAAFFRGRHDESRAAVSLLMSDVMKGLTALRVAAMSISAEYLTGDALAQATNEDVYNAFHAVDGQETLSGAWEQGGEDPANGVPDGSINPPPINPYEGMDSCPTGDQREETPERDLTEVVGEGTAAYTISGDNERMHGNDLRLDTSGLR
ncbi:hypothetical protein [Micromonospora sp. LOL_024]|uniref:hypothetical protein n=1 Tax=Micromonospora sp. LOL_024 TaxID=3345412 RepID=UPI003A86B87B